MRAAVLVLAAAWCLDASLGGLWASELLSQASAPTGMVHVPAGEFWMGRVRLWMIDEIGWQIRERADDRPVHLTHVDGFYIDAYEVSNQQFAAFVKATGAPAPYQWRGRIPPPDRAKIPVYNVSWQEATAYCAWQGKRLPTETEWEKAARGGLDREDYPWGNQYETEATDSGRGGKANAIADPDVGDRDSTAASAARAGQPDMVSHAWSNSAHGPTMVGSYQPNGYGLYDVSGNVWEWTNDWYDLHAYGSAERRNPQGPTKGLYKVIRGGGWSDDDPRYGSVYIRNFANPELKAPTIGFRCAMSESAASRR